jgi:hypothetical protein
MALVSAETCRSSDNNILVGVHATDIEQLTWSVKWQFRVSGKVLQLVVHLCDDDEDIVVLFKSTSAGVSMKTQDLLFLKSLYS